MGTMYATKEDIEAVNIAIQKVRKELDEVKWTLSLYERLESIDSAKPDREQDRAAGCNSPIVDARIRLNLKVPPPDSVDINNLTPFQFLMLAIENAKAAIVEDVLPIYKQKIDEISRSLSDVLAVLELQDIEKKYSDFENYREATRKILETSKTPLTIEQAYLLAKKGNASK